MSKHEDIVLFLLADTMDTWDQQKLEEVVEQKHGEKDTKNTTEIVRLHYTPMTPALFASVYGKIQSALFLGCNKSRSSRIDPVLLQEET